MTSYLEENLYKDSREIGKVARTAEMFQAVEEGDADTVEAMLQKIRSNMDYNYSYMWTPPGLIFPLECYENSPIYASPMALALKQKDVKMLSLLCSSAWCRLPLFCEPIHAYNKATTLCFGVLQSDKDFFKNPLLADLPCQAADDTGMTQTMKWSVRLAEVFMAVGTKNLQEVKSLFNDLHSQFESLEEPAKWACINSRTPTIDDEDVDNLWVSHPYIEKSLVMMALENQDMKMFEFLEPFCKTDLGAMVSYKEDVKQITRNNMTMWYLLIKFFLLRERAYRFLHELCQKETFWNSPAIVGCLFSAARREDLDLMKLISNEFSGQKNWFYAQNSKGMTAHNMLVTNRLEKEASLLKLYMVTYAQSTDIKDEDVTKEMDSAVSLDNFKALIDINPNWLCHEFGWGKTLIMLFSTTSNFTLEKFEFLLKEKASDINTVTTSTQMNLLNIMLQNTSDVKQAEDIQGVLLFEEVEELLLRTPGYVADIVKKMETVDWDVRRVLLQCLRKVISLLNLETLFFPAQNKLQEKKVSSVFDVIGQDKEVFEVLADRAFYVVGQEENPIDALIHLLCLYYEQAPMPDLNLFKGFFKALDNEKKRQAGGYSSALHEWRDKYGMTFLMKLLVATERHERAQIQVEDIILGNFFDNDFMNIQAEMSLNTQFDLQHRLGVVSGKKEKNTVIAPDQVLKMKRVRRMNEDGKYENVVASKEGQVKLLSEKKVTVKEGGVERHSRVMVTVKESIRESDDQVEIQEDLANDTDVGDSDIGEAVSIDGDVNEEEEQRVDLDLPIYELEKKVGDWTVNNIKETGKKHSCRTRAL